LGPNLDSKDEKREEEAEKILVLWSRTEVYWERPSLRETRRATFCLSFSVRVE
jgi:hypothetical protein